MHFCNEDVQMNPTHVFSCKSHDLLPPPSCNDCVHVATCLEQQPPHLMTSINTPSWGTRTHKQCRTDNCVLFNKSRAQWSSVRHVHNKEPEDQRQSQPPHRKLSQFCSTPQAPPLCSHSTPAACRKASAHALCSVLDMHANSALSAWCGVWRAAQVLPRVLVRLHARAWRAWWPAPAGVNKGVN